MAGMALLLIRRRWWVWLGFATPALVFWSFSTLASDGSAFLSFLGIALAVIVALVEIPISIARLTHEIRRPPLDGHAAT
jgi:hypothetical protein